MGRRHVTSLVLLALLSMGVPGVLFAGLGNTDWDGDGVAANRDCDDRNPRIYPGRPEVCDGWDNDCDGAVDQGCMGQAPVPTPQAPSEEQTGEPQENSPQQTPAPPVAPPPEKDRGKPNPKVFVDGRDNSLPSDFQCNGAGCQGSLNPLGGAIAGVFTEHPPATAIDSAPVGGAILSGSEIKAAGGVVTSAQQWRDFVHLLLSRAETIQDGSASLGTRENPRILFAPDGLRFGGNADGAGILIVSGEAEFRGTFHFEGLVIVLNAEAGRGASLRLAAGTADIFGAVVVISEEASEAIIGGNPRIAYSREALERLFTGPNALTLFPRVVSWRTY